MTIRGSAALVLLWGCQPAPASPGVAPVAMSMSLEAGPAEAGAPVVAPVTPAGPPTLRAVETLGLAGRQIVFIRDDRWLSSAGREVTLWEGHVPRTSFDLAAYNYLAVSVDGARVYGDQEAVELATGSRTPALGVPPKVLDEGRPDGRGVQNLRVVPDGALGLLELDWRAPRGIPRGDGTYRYGYPNSAPEATRQWYVVEAGTGATRVALPAGNSPFSAFSPGRIAVGGTPKEGEITVLPRPQLAPAMILSMGDTYVNQVEISPDERWLAAADNTGQIALWDMSKGTAAPTIWAAHDKPTGGIAFHPGSGLLVTTGFDLKVKLWRLGARPELVATAAIAGQPLAAAFQPGGRRLLVGVDRHEAMSPSMVVFELGGAGN